MQLQLEYPVIYSITLLKQHKINNGKGMDGVAYQLEYKGINAYGNTISNIVWVNRFQNGACTGATFKGSIFVRD